CLKRGPGDSRKERQQQDSCNSNDLPAERLALQKPQENRKILAQHQRVGDSCFSESFPAKDTTVAMTARMTFGRRVVTAQGQPVVESKCDATPNDVRFRKRDERGMNVKACALDAGARRHGRK